MSKIETGRPIRDIANDLVEIGAVQLPYELTPPYEDFFKGLIDFLGTTGSSSKLDIGMQLQRYALWDVLDRLIRHVTPGRSIVRVNLDYAFNRESIPNSDLHQDYFGQNLSCVWMHRATDDRLHTYGRGHGPSDVPKRTFFYTGGPIILAGQGFGGDLDYTWHMGEGESTDSPFFGLDVFTDDIPGEFSAGVGSLPT